MARTALTETATHGSDANAIVNVAADIPQFNNSLGHSLVVNAQKTLVLINPTGGAAVHVSIPSAPDAQGRTSNLIFRRRIPGGAVLIPPKFRSQGWSQGVEGIHIDADETIHSEATLTLAGQVTANDTVTLGNTTYTFVASATVVGNVAIGSSVLLTLTNLAAAINGTDGLNDHDPAVTALTPGSSTLIVEATVGGSGGDSIASTSSLTNVSSGWDAATLGTTVAGGAGSARLRYIVLADPVD